MHDMDLVLEVSHRSTKTLLGSYLWCILEEVRYNSLTSSLLGKGVRKAFRGRTRPRVYTSIGVL
jgi:hypothetical protein